MNERESYKYGHHSYGSGDHEFVVYRGSQRGQSARCDPPGEGLRHITDGLRVLDCFSPLERTLTADEISDLLDLPEREVTQHAERLAGLGYLQAASSDEGGWTLIDVDGTW